MTHPFNNLNRLLNLKKSKSEKQNILFDDPELPKRTIKVTNKDVQYILDSFEEVKKREEKISKQNFEISTLVFLFIFIS